MSEECISACKGINILNELDSLKDSGKPSSLVTSSEYKYQESKEYEGIIEQIDNDGNKKYGKIVDGRFAEERIHMNELSADFYSVNDDDEYITATSIDQAVVDWYEGLDEDDIELPHYVTVYGYVREVISDKQPYWWLEYIVECLDENYGCEETNGDYSLSNKAQELWKAFTDQVIKEYPVSQLKTVGKIEVKVEDYYDQI